MFDKLGNFFLAFSSMNIDEIKKLLKVRISLCSLAYEVDLLWIVVLFHYQT